MGVALGLDANGRTSAELRALSGKCPDGAQVRRILAIAMVLEGRSRTEAAELNGMDRQTLRDWVHRYNASGSAGLKSRLAPGRAPPLTAGSRGGVARTGDHMAPIQRPTRWCAGGAWTCATEVAAGVSASTVHENTVGKWLHELGLTRLQPRPVHPQEGRRRPRRLLKKLRQPGQSRAARQPGGQRRPLEIWFQDEARVGQKGTHAYIWAPIGSRPSMVRDNRHDSAYIFGAICPGPRGRRRHDHAHGQHRGDERASRGNQHAGGRRRPRRAGLRWRWLASDGARTECSRQHHLAVAAALFTRAEPDGECLGLSAAEQTLL